MLSIWEKMWTDELIGDICHRAFELELFAIRFIWWDETVDVKSENGRASYSIHFFKVDTLLPTSFPSAHIWEDIYKGDMVNLV